MAGVAQECIEADFLINMHHLPDAINNREDRNQ